MLVDGSDVMLVDRGALFFRLLAVIVGRVEAGERQVPEQMFDELLFLVGDRGVTLELLGVDDGEVQTGFRCVIEKDGIDDLARGGRQAEADIAHSEDGLAFRQCLFDQAHALNGFDRAADVIFVTGGAGEHERVENQILLGNPALDAIIAGAPGDGEFAFARDRLGLEFVLVDGADDEGRAELLHERQDLVEFFLAVLEIDRVDDAFAEAIRERALDGASVRRVDHERHFDLVDDLLVKAVDVGQLVAVGVFEVDVDDVRAALDLGAGDLGGFLEFLVGDETLERARADFVGAFADDERAVVVGGLDEFDAGVPGFARRAECARRLPVDHLRDGLDVCGRGAATAADDVEPAVFHEALQCGGEGGRRFEIQTFLVRQSRVGIAGDARVGHLMDGADVIGHEFGTGRRS